MPGSQRHHRRLEPGPERGRADDVRQLSAGPCATVPTAQLVHAMLDHADWRQLGALVATEPPARPALPKIEPTSASATRIRVVIDDLIHLILRPQLTTPTPMPALPTSPAALAFPGAPLLYPSRSPPPPPPTPPAPRPPPPGRFSPWPSARAPARRCARVFGGSIDGGRELVRES